MLENIVLHLELDAFDHLIAQVGPEEAPWLASYWTRPD